MRHRRYLCGETCWAPAIAGASAAAQKRVERASKGQWFEPRRRPLPFFTWPFRTGAGAPVPNGRMHLLVLH